MAMVMKCNEADEVLDFLFIMRIDFVLADDVEIPVLSLCGLRLFCWGVDLLPDIVCVSIQEWACPLQIILTLLDGRLG